MENCWEFDSSVRLISPVKAVKWSWSAVHQVELVAQILTNHQTHQIGSLGRFFPKQKLSCQAASHTRRAVVLELVVEYFFEASN